MKTLPSWRGAARGRPSAANLAPISARTRHVLPHTEGPRPQQAMDDGAHDMTSETKELLDESVYRQEALRLRGGCEPAYLPLALPRGLMRDLGAIVRVLPGAAYHRRHGRPVRGRVAAQLVRDHASRRAALSVQQRPKEPRRGLPTAVGRYGPDSTLADTTSHRDGTVTLRAGQSTGPCPQRNGNRIQKSVANPDAVGSGCW